MRKIKRVVHITTVHNPYDPRIYYKQCMSLHKAGYEVILIAPQPDVYPKSKLRFKIKYFPIKLYKSRLKRMVFGVSEAYKNAKRLNADIYVFHDPELLFAASCLKKRDNIIIYDIHEDYVTGILQKKYIPSLFRQLIAKGYKVIENLLIGRMELSLAEKYYKDIYRKGTCILNYPLINENLLEYKNSDSPRVNKVLYTGNVTVDRGALIHAKLPVIDSDLTVKFVGKCSRSLAESMYEVAGDNKEKIQIRGIEQFIIKDEIEKAYQSEKWLAGIALFPPTEHYMKKVLTKFYEYMNAGLPIICSNFPVWKEFVEKYKCGIVVDPFNEKEIKSALDTLRANPRLADKMGNNGRKAVLEELNWEVQESKLLSWYEQLLERKDSNNV